MASLSTEASPGVSSASSPPPTSADAPTAAAKKIEISIKDWDPGCQWTAIGAFTPSQSWGDVLTWWCEERKSSTRRGDGLAEYARFMILDVLYDKKSKNAEIGPKFKAYLGKMSDTTHTEMLLGDMDFLWTAEYPIDRINLLWNRARTTQKSCENSQHKKGKPNHNFFAMAKAT